MSTDSINEFTEHVCEILYSYLKQPVNQQICQIIADKKFYYRCTESRIFCPNDLTTFVCYVGSFDLIEYVKQHTKQPLDIDRICPLLAFYGHSHALKLAIVAGYPVGDECCECAAVGWAPKECIPLIIEYGGTWGKTTIESMRNIKFMNADAEQFAIAHGCPLK